MSQPSLQDEIRAEGHRESHSRGICIRCFEKWPCIKARAADELDRLIAKYEAPGAIVFRTDGPYVQRFDNTAAAPNYMPSRRAQEGKE